jgi:hypothetical protein
MGRAKPEINDAAVVYRQLNIQHGLIIMTDFVFGHNFYEFQLFQLFGQSQRSSKKISSWQSKGTHGMLKIGQSDKNKNKLRIHLRLNLIYRICSRRSQICLIKKHINRLRRMRIRIKQTF